MSSALPSWFRDIDIRGGRAVAILRQHGIEPNDRFGQLVCIEMMAARERATAGKRPINAPWGLWVRLCRMAGIGDPKPLCYSAEGEAIKERLAKQGALR